VSCAFSAAQQSCESRYFSRFYIGVVLKNNQQSSYLGSTFYTYCYVLKVGPKSWAVGSGLNLFSNIAVDGSNGLYRYFDYVVDYCS
jgi:hypothetical protein